jgi:unsaturated chondroitin disaccharide hydrolase
MKMKKLLQLFFLFVLLTACTNSSDKLLTPKLLDEISSQLDFFAQKTKDSTKVARSFSEKEGYKMVNYRDWTSGFPAGTFWLMHDLTGNEHWISLAKENTAKLEKVYTSTHTHDLGFIAYLSYGNGYRITHDSSYRAILLKTADTLIKRFNPQIGCIRSWDFGSWQYPVIIDNMMNLEFLLWASKETGNPVYRNIAVSHADKTLQNHFRSDWSSYHVVSYDTLTHGVEVKETHQGYNHESAWGRGQAWGLYGFTMMYRETGDPKYLNAAEKIAAYIISKLPEDAVSYWDYNDPKIPDSYRDASAASVTASALIELSGFDKSNASFYIATAKKILKSLTSEKYRAGTGENGGFLLKHSVGNLPKNSEVDVAIGYADYYYVEALKRLKVIE